MITILLHYIAIRMQRMLKQQHKLWPEILQVSAESPTVSMI